MSETKCRHEQTCFAICGAICLTWALNLVLGIVIARGAAS